jgi:hypothetical protein
MELSLHSSIHPFGYPENILKSCVLSSADEDKRMLLVLIKALGLDDPETSTAALGLIQPPIQWVPWSPPPPLPKVKEFVEQ